MSGVEVEYMLKYQESRLKSCMENLDKKHEERMAAQSRNFEYVITKLHDVSKEHLSIFEQNVSELKAYLELLITELEILLVEKVKKLKANYTSLDKKVEIVANATTRIMEDIVVFDIDYSNILKVKE